MSREKLKLAIIQTDGGTQARAELDKSVVADYAKAYKRGDKLPPIIVFFDGKRYWLSDGFHRHYAMLFECEIKEASCDVRKGTKEDAQWFALGANRNHGLRMTTKDKRRAIELALTNPHSEGWSDNRIADYIGVSQPTVAACRKAMIGGSKILNLETRVGADGKQYPATQPPRQPPADPPADHEPSGIVETDTEVVFSPPASSSDTPMENPAESREQDKADKAADEWAAKWMHKHKLSPPLAASKLESLASRVRAKA